MARIWQKAIFHPARQLSEHALGETRLFSIRIKDTHPDAVSVIGGFHASSGAGTLSNHPKADCTASAESLVTLVVLGSAAAILSAIRSTSPTPLFAHAVPGAQQS